MTLGNRAKINEATLQLLRQKPVKDFRISDVAELAGVTAQTVYNLVGNTDSVLAWVLDDASARVSAALQDEPGLDRDNPLDAVADLATAMVQVMLQDPLPLKAVLSELGPLRIYENMPQGLAVPLERLLLKGGSKFEVAQHTAHLIVLGFRGIMVSWAHGLVDDNELETHAIALARAVTHGVASQTA